MYLIRPITEIAKQWVRDNVNLEPWQWLGRAFAVDHHYVGDLVEGMMGSGLAVDVDFTVEHA